MAGLSQDNLRIPKTIKLFIGGEFPRTESGRSFPVYRHKTKKVFAHLCLASRKDFRNAVTAAKEALRDWESRSAYNRAQILYRMAEMLEGKRGEIVEIFRETLGMPEAKAHLEVDAAIDAFIYYAGFADKFPQVMGAVNPVSGPHHNFTSTEPVGVVGLIAAEKFSLARTAAAIAAILCSGNTLVVLLAETGAAVIAPLAEMFATSDLPKGVVNLLSGKMDELYKYFATHMEIQSLCYQGSDVKILGELRALAVENMKRIIGSEKSPLELENIVQFVEYKTVWHPIGY